MADLMLWPCCTGCGRRASGLGLGLERYTNGNLGEARGRILEVETPRACRFCCAPQEKPEHFVMRSSREVSEAGGE